MKNQPIRGVIFGVGCALALGPLLRGSDDALVGYFRPTKAQIQTLEARLRPALELGRTKPENLARLSATATEDRAEESWAVRGALAEILEHYTDFRRQYVGIVVRGGERRVFANSFPEVGADGTDDDPHWTVHFVDGYDDGGSSYWRIEYDVASGRFLGFDVNPSG